MKSKQMHQVRAGAYAFPQWGGKDENSSTLHQQTDGFALRER